MGEVLTEQEKLGARNEQAVKPLVFAYYVTGHGLGHATRVIEVARHLCGAGHEVHVVTVAPEYVFRRDIPSPKLHIRKVLLDCGAVQSDALTVDCLGSLEQYSRTAVVNRTALLAVEVEWLRSIKANLVVSDIVPIACKAAAQVGIPSVCVSNFSWDFIYSEYVTVAGNDHRSIVWQIAEDYSHALFVIRLPGYCPMPAFRDVIDVPMIVRKVHRSRQQVRKDLGISEKVKVLLFNFGGQDARWSLKEEYIPQGWLCLVCGAPAEQQLASNFIRMDRDSYMPDLIAASDCMLGKIGYGTVSETLSCNTPLVFVRRDHFSEEPFLRKMLEFNRGGVEMNRRDFLSGRWVPYLERALVIRPSFSGPVNGGEVAASLLEDAAHGKAYTIEPESGSRRLRDAIVFGFQMQRHPGREIDIPDWYMPTAICPGLGPVTRSHDSKGILQDAASNELGLEFEILEGSLHGLPDTASFLRSLARLDNEGDVQASDRASKPREREWLAAAGIFRWEDDIYVSRAPGRLDVMGGIADYSGSLVLQLPIKEACHVAVQRSPPGKQRLWKHTMARQMATGQGLTPVVCIVSFGSDLSNRAPTFDMDLADLFDSEGEPIAYDVANKYFDQDASQKWAAYVAGTLLVLMRELGVRFHDSISILVSSAVPEGKGVSSSAALEVATMTAIAAAHGLTISPRDLAILCQKVENHVVGAPCGVMDQMASACGEANKLLAMVCQPAEVKEHVNIPHHVQFWGIDSGIRHSVGGADYGSVRVGTFMGRRIIQGTASKLANSFMKAREEADDVELALSTEDAEEEYLCNIPPHRLESGYEAVLPTSLSGERFLEMFSSHNDPFTKIKPDRIYDVKVPAAHPIYENFRVKAFATLLTAVHTDMQLEALGELMYQSHYSYSRCRLGSHGTDRLVSLVKQTRNQAYTKGTSLFGAKITGGGCGGTVCVLGRTGAASQNEILQIQQQYKSATGHLPFIFEGSSMGAGQFGFLRIRRWSSKTMS
ncbi:unnamed protein product [Sphagnum jensenii]|uniref:L-arabinokinase n=1 Tax=Sphagnum jensenii TaxID=128206 RepID=A0ABP0WME4_9BRYO